MGQHLPMDLCKFPGVRPVCTTLHRERSPHEWTTHWYMDGWHRNRWVYCGRNKQTHVKGLDNPTGPRHQAPVVQEWRAPQVDSAVGTIMDT